MATNENDQSFLSGLLSKRPVQAEVLTPTPLTSAPSLPESVRSPSTIERRERRRRIKPGTYDKIGTSITYSAGIAIAGLLWIAGAYFTLQALKAFNVRTTSILWWTVPIAITAIELWQMPKAGQRWQASLLFVCILGIDVASSWYGLLETVAGRFVPLGTGFTIPTGGTALHLGVVIVALVFAFLPEKLIRWAVDELATLWG